MLRARSLLSRLYQHTPRQHRSLTTQAATPVPSQTEPSKPSNPTSPPEPRATFTATETDDGTRLDRFIKRRAPGLPAGLIQRLIRKRRILLNKETAIRNAEAIRANDVVSLPGEIKLGLTRGKRAPRADDVSLADAEIVRGWVLHRDARTVVLNKPAGLATQGGSGVGRCLERLLGGLGAGRYWLVHRLDREVGGAIVVARDVGAAGMLGEMFRERRVRKVYWGLLSGVPGEREGVVEMEIGGKRAYTRWRVVHRLDNRFSWLELEPRTGRKHQLRVHCAEGLGMAIVGDSKFGWKGDEDGLGRIEGPGLHLFARRIEYPRLTGGGGGKRAIGGGGNGGMIRVVAPLPKHMSDTWKRFGLSEKWAE